MANPEQQGLKLHEWQLTATLQNAEMANPEQQGLKQFLDGVGQSRELRPKWLIQNNKD